MNRPPLCKKSCYVPPSKHHLCHCQQQQQSPLSLVLSSPSKIANTSIWLAACKKMKKNNCRDQRPHSFLSLYKCQQMDPIGIFIYQIYFTTAVRNKLFRCIDNSRRTDPTTPGGYVSLISILRIRYSFSRMAVSENIPHSCPFFSTDTIFGSIFLHAKTRK